MLIFKKLLKNVGQKCVNDGNGQGLRIDVSLTSFKDLVF